MPSFTLKTNTAAFLTSNQESRAKFFTAATSNLDREELFFIGRMQETRMSGRREDPVSDDQTRVQTGMLRRNWFNNTVQQNDGIQFKVFSTTPYAPFQSARIKVATFWVSDFMPKGAEAINRAARDFLR